MNGTRPESDERIMDRERLPRRHPRGPESVGHLIRRVPMSANGAAEPSREREK